MTLERVKWFAFASVHQDYGRYELTVRDFMTLGVPVANRTEERFAYALRFAEADSFVADLPDGLVRCSVLIGWKRAVGWTIATPRDHSCCSLGRANMVLGGANKCH